MPKINDLCGKRAQLATALRQEWNDDGVAGLVKAMLAGFSLRFGTETA